MDNQTQYKTIFGPRWIIEVDSVFDGAILGADFETRSECFKFSAENAGNFSVYFIPKGKHKEYIRFKSFPDLKDQMGDWAAELSTYGTNE